MRHPDHSGGELVYYFSHHEKLCVVDGKWAAMGGLDACWGRWDTPNHPIADVHPTQFQNTLFPGQGGLLGPSVADDTRLQQLAYHGLPDG